MKKTAITTVSILALALAGAAFAQDSTTTTAQQPAQDQVQQPIQQPSTTDTAAQPSTTDATQPTTTDTAQQPVQPSTTDTAAQPSTTDTTTITQPSTTDTAQQPATTDQTTTTTTMTTTGQMNGALTVDPSILNNASTMSANDFIGKTVYSTNNENVGDINDFIFSNDGKILAAVIGVGGFLGIGEKDVLVPISSIQLVKGDDGSARLTVNATKDVLDAAPGWDRKNRRYAG